jgi:hypothetical protein
MACRRGSDGSVRKALTLGSHDGGVRDWAFRTAERRQVNKKPFARGFHA